MAAVGKCLSTMARPLLRQAPLFGIGHGQERVGGGVEGQSWRPFDGRVLRCSAPCPWLCPRPGSDRRCFGRPSRWRIPQFRGAVTTQANARTVLRRELCVRANRTTAVAGDAGQGDSARRRPGPGRASLSPLALMKILNRGNGRRARVLPKEGLAGVEAGASFTLVTVSEAVRKCAEGRAPPSHGRAQIGSPAACRWSRPTPGTFGGVSPFCRPI